MRKSKPNNAISRQITRIILCLLLALYTIPFGTVPLAQAQAAQVMQNAATANGNGSVLAVTGLATAALTVNCSGCGGGTTVNFEGTSDGTNYTAITGALSGTSTTSTSTTTAGVGVWSLPVAGFVSIRARISGYSAGTVTVTGRSSAAPGSSSGAVSISGTVNVDVVGNTIGLATGTKQDTGNASLATINTNTAPLVTAGGGGYVRQDSTATIAKESGGNLATAATGIGATTVDKCTTTDTTACTLIGLMKELSYLLQTPTGPAAAANSNSQIIAYPTLIQGGITTAMTATTSTAFGGGFTNTASNYIYITDCQTSNGSTTVSTDILLQDGSGGTTVAVLPAPAAAVAGTGGNGGSYSWRSPLKLSVNTALYAANVTTGSSTKVWCSGFKSTISY